MDCKPPTSRPSRRQTPRLVLVSRHDGTLELYADGSVDVCVVRVPVSHRRQAEQLADDIAALLAPRRFRSLIYSGDKLRLVASTRPLLPSVAHAAIVTRAQIADLNALTAVVKEKEGEVCAWTL